MDGYLKQRPLISAILFSVKLFYDTLMIDVERD